MPTSFDVAIIGLGAMGSAAAYHLSRRGQKVLGIDRFAPPHDQGSSHGKSRMIREAYFEHPLYVPLVQRAFALWSELEHDAGGQTFLHHTGGLMVGTESSPLIQGTLRSATAHRIPHEVLSAGKLHRRYPAFAPLDDMVGVLETRAGILLPDEIISAQLSLAADRGADFRLNEAVVGWERSNQGIDVRTSSGTVNARQVVVTAGSWLGELLPELALPLSVERQVIHWFEANKFPEYHTADRMPVSLWQLANGQVFYTKPDIGDGIKVGVHHGGRTQTASTLDRQVSPSEDAEIFDLLRRFVPFAKGSVISRAVCMYTNTPDEHFIVDRHPGVSELLVVSACSGHGFKFASVIGEIVADLITTGVSKFDLSPFSISRFANT